MSLSPSTVTLSAFASTHIWDYRVCVQPTRRASSHFAKRSPTKKLLLFNSLFSWMLLWNQTSVNVFFGCAPGFRHHDVIVWNCRNSRLVMSWRSITTISRWVPVVAGSRVTWNSIFYIFEFSFRVFVGNDIQFLSECESRWIWNVCAGFERSLLWLHIFSNALVAKRINLHPC